MKQGGIEIGLVSIQSLCVVYQQNCSRICG